MTDDQQVTSPQLRQADSAAFTIAKLCLEYVGRKNLDDGSHLAASELERGFVFKQRYYIEPAPTFLSPSPVTLPGLLLHFLTALCAHF